MKRWYAMIAFDLRAHMKCFMRAKNNFHLSHVVNHTSLSFSLSSRVLILKRLLLSTITWEKQNKGFSNDTSGVHSVPPPKRKKKTFIRMPVKKRKKKNPRWSGKLIKDINWPIIILPTLWRPLDNPNTGLILCEGN